MSTVSSPRSIGFLLCVAFLIVPCGLAGQVPPEPSTAPTPSQAPAAPVLDSLRARLDALNREQMEEVRRVLESRQEEFEAVRDAMRSALERNESGLEEARRNLEEVRRRSTELSREAEALLREALQMRQQLMRDQLGRGFPDASSRREERVLEGVFAPEALPFFTGQRFVAGVELAPLNPSLAQYFGIDEGVLVIEVTEGSPGARAGLEAGDVIVEAGGESVTTVQELREAVGRLTTIGYYVLQPLVGYDVRGGRVQPPVGYDVRGGHVDPPADDIVLGVVRGGEPLELTMTR